MDRRAVHPGAGADGWGIDLGGTAPAHGDDDPVTRRRGADLAVHHGERTPLW
jgi:hypothetical protein